MYVGIVAHAAALRAGRTRERVMAQALETLTAGVPATRAWMWSVDRHGHRDAAPFVVLARGRQPRVPEQAGREYMERYWVDDPFSPHRFTDRRHRVVTLEGIGGADALRRSAYGQEFLPESGFRHRICVHFWHDGRLVSVATLMRTDAEPPFDGRDVVFLHRAQPLVAYAYAQAVDCSANHPSELLQSLRPRQAQVARLAAQGLTNAEIAAALMISPATVKRHLATIYATVGVRSRLELGLQIARRGTMQVKRSHAAPPTIRNRPRSDDSAVPDAPRPLR
jgi:DNA-binding CsgD family transcriptional regulator